MSQDHPPKAVLIEQLKRSISGFTPAQTGGLCDTCNAALAEGDEVYVYADWYEGNWGLRRTACASCGDRLDDRELVEAIVKCELGYSQSGEFFPLHNPSVYQMNTSEGAVVR
jgi:hypothetical protein